MIYLLEWEEKELVYHKAIEAKDKKEAIKKFGKKKLNLLRAIYLKLN